MPGDAEARPKLRAVRTSAINHAGRPALLLQDPLGITQEALVLPAQLGLLLSLLDGTRTEGALRAALEVRAGIRLSPGKLSEMLDQLDRALFLDNERFREAQAQALAEYRGLPAREPALAGKSYPAESEGLKALLEGYLTQASAPAEASSPVLGLVSPHIDYARGGPTYAQVWSAAKDAVQGVELAIILGTDHLGGEGRLTLTRQNYATPFGILPTAREAVERLAQAMGEEKAFADELHHRSEHSVELSAVWLHYFLGERKCALLPILCGSFQPFLEQGQSPAEDPLHSAAIEVLREIAAGQPSLVVASADLAHVGPAFGDPRPLTRLEAAQHANRDRTLLEAASAADAEGAFRLVAAEGDRRRVCGLPPIYLALKILEGARGEALAYAQCPADESGGSFVSIAGVLFRGG